MSAVDCAATSGVERFISDLLVKVAKWLVEGSTDGLDVHEH